MRATASVYDDATVLPWQSDRTSVSEMSHTGVNHRHAVFVSGLG